MGNKIRPRRCDECGIEVWPRQVERKGEPWHVYDCPGCGGVKAYPLRPAGVAPRVPNDHHQDTDHG